MIIVRLSGGMGNQMFQYAAGRALAIKRNVALALDCRFLEEIDRVRLPLLRPHFTPRNYQLDVFAINARRAEGEEIPWYARPFFSGKIAVIVDALLRKVPILPGWEKGFRFDERIINLGPNTYLCGFWQSEKYFADSASAIRDDFTLHSPLSERIEALRKEIQSKHSLCIHVRRTDITNSSFHGGVSRDYYNRAIERIISEQSVDHIYIFSDDIDWCVENLSFSLPMTCVGMEYAGEKDSGHFALMQACTHFIIPNSTFSWWAAWLGNNPDKIVIAPKQWFKDSLNDASDLIPYSWVRL